MNYLPATENDKKKMLEKIGVDSIEELFDDVPDEVKFKGEMKIPKGIAEFELKRAILDLSSQNSNMDEYISFLGGGAYDHYMPMIVDHMLQRSEWYSAYTPYQPEISQGTLQNIFEFQTLVCELFGMEISNASVYDGATALADAMLMTCESGKEIVVSRAVNPEYREVLETYTNGLDVEVKEVELDNLVTPVENYKPLLNDNTGALVVQYPNFFGNIEDIKAIADLAHENGSKIIVVVGDIVSLGLFEAPGNLGADIVVGEGMSFAGPINFSGPSIGLIGARKELIRKMPGRIVGMTTDPEGTRSFVMTLQAREQHIRRGRALSNICTNQALFSLATNITLSTLGTKGLRDISIKSMQNAAYALERFTAIEGVEKATREHFFDEFTLKLPIPAGLLNKRLLKKGIFGCVDAQRWYPEYPNMGIFFTSEFRTKKEIDYTAECMEVIFNAQKFK